MSGFTNLSLGYGPAATSSFAFEVGVVSNAGLGTDYGYYDDGSFSPAIIYGTISPDPANVSTATSPNIYVYCLSQDGFFTTFNICVYGADITITPGLTTCTVVTSTGTSVLDLTAPDSTSHADPFYQYIFNGTVWAAPDDGQTRTVTFT